MELYKNLIKERAHAIWAVNGIQSGTLLGDWRTAAQELGHAKALARQLDSSPSLEMAQLLQAVLDFSPAVISVKDTRGRYLLANSRFATLYQVSQNDLGHTTDYDLFPADQADSRRANDLQVIATGQPLEFEEVVRDPTGTGADRTYLSLKFPIAGPDGRPFAVGGISTDVTERKRAQRSLLIQHAVTRALVDAATWSEVEPAVLQAVCVGLGWDVGLLWRVDPIAKLLRCVDVWHVPDVTISAFEKMGRGMTLSAGVGLAGRVWATGQPIWLEKVVTPSNIAHLQQVTPIDFMPRGCAFPLRNGGEVLGVIEFFSHEFQRADPELLEVMDGIGSQIGQFMERRQAERAVLERTREFDLARRIQLGLLPKTPPTMSGFAIDGASRPAQETGGDYLDFIPMQGESLGIAIGDASGHGIGAALVMTETRAYLRARAAIDTDVGRLLEFVNQQLTADWPENQFVTLFFGRLDGATRTLTYSNAGHWPGYVLDALGNVREKLGATNIPLGLDLNSKYPVASPLVLGPGELVLLLTDGILEAQSPEGTMFGIDRALSAVRANRSETPGDIIAALFGAVHAFSHDTQADDMTAIIIKVDSNTT